MKAPRFLMLAFLLAAAVSAPSQAQRPPQNPQRAPSNAERMALEGQIRRGFARAVRQRVGLSETQMSRLAPITQRHEQLRRELQLSERRTRLALQAAIRDSAPDSAVVSGHLQSLIDLQKRRVQILETEQRELAAILSPIQRARYMALQEQVRRRLEQMRQRRAPRDDVAPVPRPARPRL